VAQAGFPPVARLQFPAGALKDVESLVQEFPVAVRAASPVELCLLPVLQAAQSREKLVVWECRLAPELLLQVQRAVCPERRVRQPVAPLRARPRALQASRQAQPALLQPERLRAG